MSSDSIRQESLEVSRGFVNFFAGVHLQDRELAFSMLITAFISCYSVLSSEERVRLCAVLFEFIQDISGERFEDGADFVTFIKEKSEERRDAL